MPTPSPTSAPISRRPGQRGAVHVDADPLVELGPRRHPAGASAARRRARSKIGSVSITSFSTRPGTPTISLTRRTPCCVDAEVDDEVDRRRHRGDHEAGRDVLPGQQRQGAHLDQRLAGAVGVDRAHARKAGVEGEQQVEALLGAHLADDDPARPHPQALLDQVAQPDLAGALEPGLPGLQRHPVRVREPQLEDLLRGDHPLAAGDRRRQAVEHRGLAGLRAAGDEDVEPGAHGGLEEGRRAGRQAAQLDEVVEPGRAEHELADVHRREARG